MGEGEISPRNLPGISKLADTSGIDSFRATSMPNLHQPLDDTTKEKLRVHPGKVEKLARDGAKNTIGLQAT